MTDTFEFKVQQGYSVNYKPKVAIIRFHDGYEQRQPLGLNNNLRKFSGLKVILTSREDSQRLQAFLEERKGYRSFKWQLPGKDEIVNVYCSRWTTVERWGIITITMTFEETLT